MHLRRGDWLRSLDRISEGSMISRSAIKRPLGFANCASLFTTMATLQTAVELKRLIDNASFYLNPIGTFFTLEEQYRRLRMNLLGHEESDPESEPEWREEETVVDDAWMFESDIMGDNEGLSGASSESDNEDSEHDEEDPEDDDEKDPEDEYTRDHRQRKLFRSLQKSLYHLCGLEEFGFFEIGVWDLDLHVNGTKHKADTLTKTKVQGWYKSASPSNFGNVEDQETQNNPSIRSSREFDFGSGQVKIGK
jgi:hypothetical protein